MTDWWWVQAEAREEVAQASLQAAEARSIAAARSASRAVSPRPRVALSPAPGILDEEPIRGSPKGNPSGNTPGGGRLVSGNASSGNVRRSPHKGGPEVPAVLAMARAMRQHDEHLSSSVEDAMSRIDTASSPAPHGSARRKMRDNLATQLKVARLALEGERRRDHTQGAKQQSSLN